MPDGSDWFRALIDSAPDVYFRYSFVPARRFDYVSPAVETLTGYTAAAFQADAALCVGLVARDDRRLLRQIVRARRGLTATLRLRRRDGVTVPVAVRTVPLIRGRQLCAVEGIACLACRADRSRPHDGSELEEPSQQRLASLMYEVHALLHQALAPRLTAGDDRHAALRAGAIAVDADRMTVALEGCPVQVTVRELLVLKYLIQHAGRVVTRAQLLADVWGYQYTGDDRTVDVHVSRLRRKLPPLRTMLVSVKHVGYRLDPDGPDVERIANF